MNVSTEGRIERGVMKFVDPSAGRPEIRLRRGDVLFNNTNSPELVGKTALFDGDDSPAFSNHMTRLRVDSKRVDPSYVALRLHQAWREGWFAQHCNNHVSQASIGRDVLKEYRIEVPPIEVQRAISLLAQSIDTRTASASRHLGAARQAMERFRRSMLAAACSGRLTADWRLTNPTTERATDLVASITAHRRERLGQRFRTPIVPKGDEQLPEGWTWTTVGALVDVATGATPLRKRADYFGGSIPWVTSGAVNAGLIEEASEYITDLAIRETNAKVFPRGTILVAMYGEGQTRGRVGELGIDAATNQAVAALLFDAESERLRDYLRIFFLENYERIRQVSFGGVQPNLSLGVIRDTALPLPPHEEQLEIVRRVKSLTAVADAVQKRSYAASIRVERTAQAVLAKAFRGELVSEDRI